MYANLAVRIDAGDGEAPEQVYAHTVEYERGVAIIHLDDNDGEGSYAEPAGERRVDLSTHAVSVRADF